MILFFVNLVIKNLKNLLLLAQQGSSISTQYLINAKAMDSGTGIFFLQPN
jgi:hypothetical protein